MRKSNPQSFQFQFNLGLAAARTGDRFIAIDAFERAVVLRPGEPQSHYELGLLYVATGRLFSAQQKYEALTDLRPNLAQHLKAEIDR